LVSLGEGGTPVIGSESLGKNYDFELFFKLEFANPTGSFKDRGTAVTVSKAQEWGLNTVADDSSGNAGASLAAYAARAGLDCRIYVPASASGNKISQIRSYGAELEKVPGPREKATERIKEDTSDGEVYYASHNVSPYFSEGMKTVAYEISEEFDWDPPEHLVVPVGGGALLAGIHNGFRDLINLGFIERIPKLHAVQTQSCNPVVKAFDKSWDRPRAVVPGLTIAEGAHISNPERGGEILEAIRHSDGVAVAVSERKIREYHRKLAEKEGLFVEPTSILPIAGLGKLNDLGVFGSGERVLAPLTGSGLKDVEVWNES
jgi:threonine synthase